MSNIVQLSLSESIEIQEETSSSVLVEQAQICGNEPEAPSPTVTVEDVPSSVDVPEHQDAPQDPIIQVTC